MLTGTTSNLPCGIENDCNDELSDETGHDMRDKRQNKKEDQRHPIKEIVFPSLSCH